MATANQQAANGRATTNKTTFSRTTAVATTIQADPAIVWKLLTTANDYKRWNSTIISIDGEIAEGGTIQLKSSLAPKRVFKLKVKEFIAGKRLVWGDGQGMRVLELQPANNGQVTFTMEEKIGSFMFPLYAKYIPSFDASFEEFAADLKKEAEIIQNTLK